MHYVRQATVQQTLFEVIMAKTVQTRVPKAPQSRTNFAPGAKRTPQGPLQNGDAFQSLYAALREGEVRSDHV